MAPLNVSQSKIVDALRKVLKSAHAAGGLDAMTRGEATTQTAKLLGVTKEDLKPHKELIKSSIGDFVDSIEDASTSKPNTPEASPIKITTRKRKTSPLKPAKAEKRARRDSSPDSSVHTPRTTPDEDEKRPSPQASPAPKPVSSASTEKPNSKAKEDEAEKSESELSVLIDEEPPKRRKGSKKTDAPKRERKSKDKVPLSKNEEAIKRYKALVVACGVRKVWSKELANCTTESQQISHLKKMLSDLGMSGRMSMEQAKSIREKREFQQEIADVVSFEKAKGMHAATRREAKTRPRANSSTNDNASEARTKSSDGGDALTDEDTRDAGSDSDEAENPKRKPTARRNIMAFLADQSDSD